MSWGINYKADIYLSRVSENDIEQHIIEKKQLIKFYEEVFISRAISTPVFTSNEQYEEWLFSVTDELKETIADYKERIIELNNLCLYKETVKNKKVIKKKNKSLDKSK